MDRLAILETLGNISALANLRKMLAHYRMAKKEWQVARLEDLALIGWAKNVG